MTSKLIAGRRMRPPLSTMLFAAALAWFAPALALLAPALLLTPAPAFAALSPGGELQGPLPKTPEPVVPALENPVTGVMEAGRLIITVASTPKYKDGPSVNYGYRTGQLIPVTVVISVDSGVHVDLGGLSSKTLSKDGSDFELVSPPVVTTLERNGKEIYVLQLLLRTWVMDPALTLSVQFHYALALLPDGKTPAWKVGTTPDFIITTSRTATENSKQLLDGDMTEKQSPVHWLAKPVECVGAVMLLLVPAWLVWKFLSLRRRNKLTASQRAWLVIDELVAARRSGRQFTTRDYEEIGAVLRQYLGIEELATAAAVERLNEFFADSSRKAELLALSMSALAKLDRAIYGKAVLNSQEIEALLQELAAIIPRQQ